MLVAVWCRTSGVAEDLLLQFKEKCTEWLIHILVSKAHGSRIFCSAVLKNKCNGWSVKEIYFTRPESMASSRLKLNLSSMDGSDIKGNTPLHLAVANQRVRAICWLVDWKSSTSFFLLFLGPVWRFTEYNIYRFKYYKNKPVQNRIV